MIVDQIFACFHRYFGILSLDINLKHGKPSEHHANRFPFKQSNEQRKSVTEEMLFYTELYIYIYIKVFYLKESRREYTFTWGYLPVPWHLWYTPYKNIYLTLNIGFKDLSQTYLDSYHPLINNWYSSLECKHRLLPIYSTYHVFCSYKYILQMWNYITLLEIL